MPPFLPKMMQLLFVFTLFLFAFTRSSKIENESDSLSSVDVIAFGYSQQVSQHWDCPQVSNHAGKAEEARIWRTVISDARVKEITAASASRTLQTAKKYKWIKDGMLSNDSVMAKSDLFMQNSVLLGMRKPNFDGGAAPLKLLSSKSKQVNQDALSVMLPHLEQSKDWIMDWMARNQASLPIISMAPKITDPLTSHRLQVPQAVNYHPRVFRHAHFTTGDLVALMAIAAESRQKGYTDAFKFFKVMVQSFLPGFSISLGAVPKNSAEEPTKTIYLHRSFNYIPAGADLAFYFDGNRGNFLSLQGDSIVLNRPEDIVDGQQHAALVLFSNENVDASNLEMRQTKSEITMRRVFHEALKEALAVCTPPKATDAEVQASGVSKTRSFTAQLEGYLFLEAQRKLLESKPTLLIELLPEKLVRLVIEYFNDDTYPVIVSTHNWTLKCAPEIAVDSARLYVLTCSEGLKGLNHSLGKVKEDERHLLEFGDPRWFNYQWAGSSHDGRYVSFNPIYKTSADLGRQVKRGTKWFMQSDESEDGGPKSVAFDGKDLPYGLLSRDGQTLCSNNYEANPTTRVYQIKEQAEKNPIALMKLEFNAVIIAVSGKGNRVMVAKPRQLQIHEIDRDTSNLVCQVDAADFGYFCALNEDGSEAAFVNSNGNLRIIAVDKIVGTKADQPAIVSVKFQELTRQVGKLVYSDGGKLHVLHAEGNVSLFDRSTKELILLEAPQKGQKVISSAISPNANYVAILLGLGEIDKYGRFEKHQTIVKRKVGKIDWKNFFGYEIDENK